MDWEDRDSHGVEPLRQYIDAILTAFLFLLLGIAGGVTSILMGARSISPSARRS